MSERDTGMICPTCGGECVAVTGAQKSLGIAAPLQTIIAQPPAALREAIEAAPHGLYCETQNVIVPAGDCTCWKADVLRMWRPKA